MKISKIISIITISLVYIFQIEAQDISKKAPPSLSKLRNKFIVRGVVKNKEGRPVDAEISWNKKGEETILGSERSNLFTGDYKIKLPMGVEYELTVSKEGYREHNFTVLAQKGEENIVDIELSEEAQNNLLEEEFFQEEVSSLPELPLKENVYFCFDKAELKYCSMELLDSLIEDLKNNPDLEINISGHTDSVGSSQYNMELSERRCCTVVRYLIDNGIEENRISCGWSGEEKPVSSNADPVGRADNRRAEIEIFLPAEE